MSDVNIPAVLDLCNTVRVTAPRPAADQAAAIIDAIEGYAQPEVEVALTDLLDLLRDFDQLDTIDRFSHVFDALV